MRRGTHLYWVREEAIGAALERLCVARPTSFRVAVAIARNAAVDELRSLTDWSRARRRPTRVAVSDPEASLASLASSDVERAIVAVERWERASERLNRQQVVALTRSIEGYTLAEIGAELGVTESRASQIITKTLKVLQGDAYLPRSNARQSTGGIQ